MVLRALVRVNVVEYRNANELLLGTIQRSVGFKSEAPDRKGCWEECEAERGRLVRLHAKLRAENVKFEHLGDVEIIDRGSSDDVVLEALHCELRRLYEPLPEPVEQAE